MSFEKVAAVAKEYQERSLAPLGFVFLDLKTGQTIHYHGDEPFPTASAYKIYILAELFRKVYAGDCKLSDRLPLTEEIKSPGSGILQVIDGGTSLTLKDYATLMMILSDNTATDVLFTFLGRDNIKKNVIDALELTHTKCDWGCKKLLDITLEKHGRTMQQLMEENGGVRPSYHNSKWFQCVTDENDQTAPLESAKLMELLYRGQWVCPEASEGMLNIMKECRTNSRIPLHLPEDTVVAHKTGTIDRLAVDLGIVYAPKGDYILSMFYNGNLAYDGADYAANKGGELGSSFLADLSGAIYQAYMED